ALVAVSQFVFTPQRDGAIGLGWAVGTGLVALGLATGVLAALLGVGGGVVVGPALAWRFGASDLVARGSSLVMMLPGAASGTLKNTKNRLPDLKTAALIGLPAAAATPLGSRAAAALDPRTNAILFGCYVAALLARSVYAALIRR
ncbi:MAG: TSUP family transporter, partial [Propionibacteriaceae bacterium]|nr:TSUP family transporter [Propionibacteriaceae bacterium]